MWLGTGLLLLSGLVVSVGIARRNGWISVNIAWRRQLAAALILVAAYPLSVFVMLGSLAVYESLYSTLSSEQWSAQLQSGSYPSSIWALYVAAIVGAVLFSVALRVLTTKWDGQTMLLLALAGVVTIPLSQGIALVINEPNWHLLLFPVGEALFSAFGGYWLMKVAPSHLQRALPTVTLP